LVAPPGKTGVTAELTCRVGDEIWNCPDRRLANRVITEAADEGFFQPQDVEQTKVLRSGFGYPICALDFEKHLGKIWQRLGTIGNLYSGGRQGLFNYAQMHFALRSGFAIAEHILSGKPKPSRQLRDNFREELFV